jgi:hypothetical protein
MVGDGSCLPVTSVGSASGPFRLSNILVAPKIVHPLLSIRQFTTDYSCSVDFDPSGLTVTDLASRRPLLRCDSTGPSTPSDFLLPLLHTLCPLLHHDSFHYLAPSARPPRPCRLAQLSHSAHLPCTRSSDEHLRHACQLGRHVRL